MATNILSIKQRATRYTDNRLRSGLYYGAISTLDIDKAYEAGYRAAQRAQWAKAKLKGRK